MTKATAPLKTITHHVGKGGQNLANDVRAVQCLLNLPRNRELSGNTGPKLTLSGVVDTATQEAITLFQAKAQKIAAPDGCVHKNGACITLLQGGLPALPNGAFSEPAWLREAYEEELEGPKEKPGEAKNNARILEYLGTAPGLAKINATVEKLDAKGKPVRDARGKKVMAVSDTTMMSQVDETAWCACFVNWCLIQADKKPIGGAQARAYSTWGNEASVDHVGSICAIQRDPFEDSGSGWHVGFFIGGSKADGYVALLGGNQRNMVCRKWYVGVEPAKIFQRWPRN